MDAKILQKARKMFSTSDYADRKKAVSFLVKNGYSRNEAWKTLNSYFQMDASRLNPEVK